ncbi:flagellar biosynthesis protein FliQ [Marinomonas mediterranea]|uniref:Flagellar biosynthetic protein FliQ n=1 Tax=Marinomonas mediterranea (strain ATCC 700492 / JCM 21426 / NBRC 103028 / MMB-1) TaxID=717774 RepID=F2K3J9_MARM1|nr:flagellar biosynthesis protein FliQ [Marinomonas mediterranea]ADZ92438.1 flagellar biosynthetic protein FliQ [Marinomonas mediterranea MMB-1]WCN10390.1 flagellar biosynthesis protein FliQ [Marinomonas mediterranea]WCN14436.1 flagellar biosynthesis protein FliQ [Marinomonas mediterranea]WCN18488.1 flagellar biosynthesis protein FliQ [Marinomonas mediterranea MMB-1]
MDPQVVLDLYGQGFYLIVLLVAAVMVPSLAVGLMVSIFQAATQINEQTLSFLPRLIVTILTIMYLGPWLLTKLTDFTNELFINIPMMIG